MKTPLLESLFNKVAGLQADCFIKKRLQHRYFLVDFAKFLKTPFFNKTPPMVASEKHCPVDRGRKLTVREIESNYIKR